MKCLPELNILWSFCPSVPYLKPAYIHHSQALTYPLPLFKITVILWAGYRRRHVT